MLKFGFITDLLSKPVRYGYVNGIALTVIVGQLPKLFGFSIDATGLIAEARAFVDGVRDGETNETALADRRRLPRDHPRVQALAAEGARRAGRGRWRDGSSSASLTWRSAPASPSSGVLPAGVAAL